MPNWIKKRRADGSMGAPEGPISSAELRSMAESGWLRGPDLIAKSPDGPWVTAAEVPALRNSLQSGEGRGGVESGGSRAEAPSPAYRASPPAPSMASGGGGSGGGGVPVAAAAADDGDEGSSGLLLMPSAIVRAVLDLLVGISGGAFHALSRAIGHHGNLGLLVGGAMGMVIILVIAIRADQLSLAVLALLVPIGVAIGQFMGWQFMLMGEGVVRNTPSRASSLVPYQFLGFLMILVAAGCVILGIIGVIREGFFLETLALPCIGIIPLTLGLLFLDAPGTLSLKLDRRCSAGEDGLALIGVLLKASMAGARLIYGASCIAGGLLLTIGAGMVIYYGQQIEAFRGFMFAYAGGVVIAQGIVFPFVTYLAAVSYFILVDVLVAVLNRGRLVS